jgi:hypothetical protein
MKQVSDQMQQPQAAGEHDKLIFLAQFGEDVLLILLVLLSAPAAVTLTELTRGSDSFTGTLLRSGGMRSPG